MLTMFAIFLVTASSTDETGNDLMSAGWKSQNDVKTLIAFTILHMTIYLYTKFTQSLTSFTQESVEK